MNIKLFAFLILSILYFCGCASKNTDPKPIQEYVLLIKKTETSATDGYSFNTVTTYKYDTLGVPVLQEEFDGNTLIKYSYTSDNLITAVYTDNTTKKVINTVKLTIDPTTKNVVKQIDNSKITYVFTYDKDGFITKNPLEEGYVYTYKEGNLLNRVQKTGGFTNMQSYTYGSDVYKYFFVPFLYGKPNKNLLTETVSSESVDGLVEPNEAITKISYVLDPNGYILTQRETFSNGYVETTFQYKTLKR